MNAAEAWVMSSRPEAPERLVARVREVLAARPVGGAAPDAVPDALVDAAESLLATVLADSGGAARDKALDLLAADACVTWAFEAAAADPASIGTRAEATMARLAQVVR